MDDFDPMAPLDPETFACAEGAACPDDCDGVCELTCSRCGEPVAPTDFVCAACDRALDSVASW